MQIVQPTNNATRLSIKPLALCAVTCLAMSPALLFAANSDSFEASLDTAPIEQSPSHVQINKVQIDGAMAGSIRQVAINALPISTPQAINEIPLGAESTVNSATTDSATKTLIQEAHPKQTMPSETLIFTNNSGEANELNAKEQHAMVIAKLAKLYQGRVPNWANDLSAKQYARLIEHSFFENGRADQLVELLQANSSMHYRALLGKYLEYQALADSGYWCTASLSASQVERIAYLLWLQGDLSTSRLSLNDSINLCSVDLKTVNEELTEQSLSSELTEALRSFQKRHKLPLSGAIDKATLSALRTPAQDISWELKSNLDRMASVHTDQENLFIIANTPAYDLTVYENQRAALSMQTIVGKKSRKTPELSLELKSVVVNPTWNVPAKLAYRDLIPKQIKDSEYLNKKNIRIYADWQSTEAIDPATINWSEARHNFPYRLKQEAGDSNALGKFKFIMPNPRAIFLHDTNSRYLFNKKKRTFSSGCVRVSKPKELALFLLRESKYGSESSIDKRLASGKTRYINLPSAVPVHVVYWTSWVDDNGYLQLRDDVYRNNPALPAPVQYAALK